MENDSSGMDRAELAIQKDRERRRKLKAKSSEQGRLQKAFCEALGTDSGKIVLYWLMHQCSFQDDDGNVNNIVDGQGNVVGQKIERDNMVFNQARRSLYLDIRKLLLSRPDILADVEIYKLNKPQGESNE